MGFEKKIAQNDVEAVLKPPRGLAYRNPRAKDALEQRNPDDFKTNHFIRKCTFWPYDHGVYGSPPSHDVPRTSHEGPSTHARAGKLVSGGPKKMMFWQPSVKRPPGGPHELRGPG